MRVPKVGEKWPRRDGKSNGITVVQVVPSVTSTPTHVHYRYDDGVMSHKPLPEFHQKFKDPQGDPKRCLAIHAPTGLRCVHPMVDHEGMHTNGVHEWSTAKYAPETKVVLSKMPEKQERLESAKKFYAENYRSHCKSYYGYDPAESNSFEQRQGDWADPNYRAKYMGFKK